MSFDYQHSYEYEFAHRESLHDTLGTPVTIVSLLGASVGAMLGGLRGPGVGADVLAFWVLASATLVLLVKSVYHFARSMHGHTYMAVDSPARLRRHHNELRDWHEAYGQGRLRGDREFEEYLERAYAEATEHNQRVNEYRGDQLYLGRRWMIFAAVATGMSAIPFLVNQQVREKTPEQFVIVTKDLPDRSAPKMSQIPTQPIPPKPVPPPLREIREGHVPRPPARPQAGPRR
ncbi:MAG TPA: hypothetical protein VFJ82_22245 [Longimicrobium sp.]|nr:hypothetical protein [Longimicrobium sp.]